MPYWTDLLLHPSTLSGLLHGSVRTAAVKAKELRSWKTWCMIWKCRISTDRKLGSQRHSKLFEWRPLSNLVTLNKWDDWTAWRVVVGEFEGGCLLLIDPADRQQGCPGFSNWQQPTSTTNQTTIRTLGRRRLRSTQALRSGSQKSEEASIILFK